MEIEGILHSTRKKGVPRFIFVVQLETGREIYLATVKKAGTALDITYLFYSRKSHHQKFLGHMKISSSSSYNPDRSELTETKFVLFGSKIELPQQISKKGLFRSKSRVRNGAIKCLPELPEDHNLELAAVIVRRREELAGGGWGLKFLRSPMASESPRKSSPATVVFAAGFHGGPQVGPASLMERWKSGGSCDCGGWDLGCPIKVLSLKEEETREGILELFMQERGGREMSPVMRMEEIKDGMFRVSSGEGVTALQSFSAALALIHVKTARAHSIDR